MALSSDLLKILACPDCKSPVKLNGESLVCVSPDCRRQYAVKEQIPVMLIDQSIVIDPSEHRKLIEA